MAGGAFSAATGRHTGRAPRDRYIVEQPEIAGRDRLGQGQPADRACRGRAALGQGAGRTSAGATCYVQDLHAGADPAHRLRVRVITETAWHSLFARNMFRRAAGRRRWPTSSRTSPCCSCRACTADPATDGTRSETAILLDLAARQVLICGTPLCRRDQEVDLHRAQLPAAGRRRAADALLGQRRRAGRRRDLLRPVRHRQDHALGRPDAHPDRRRRARLGRRTASSTSRAAATPR